MIIKCKPVVEATDIRGNVVKGANGEPVKATLKELLYALTELKEFHGELRGVKATVLSYDAGKFIASIDESADEFDVPDELLEAFRRALDEWRPMPAFAHCFAEMTKALAQS